MIIYLLAGNTKEIGMLKKLKIGYGDWISLIKSLE